MAAVMKIDGVGVSSEVVVVVVMVVVLLLLVLEPEIEMYRGCDLKLGREGSFPMTLPESISTIHLILGLDLGSWRARSTARLPEASSRATIPKLKTSDLAVAMYFVWKLSGGRYPIVPPILVAGLRRNSFESVGSVIGVRVGIEVVLEPAGQTEVAETGVEVGIEHDVAGFDVAVDDLSLQLLVEVEKRGGEAADYLLPPLPIERRVHALAVVLLTSRSWSSWTHQPRSLTRLRWRRWATATSSAAKVFSKCSPFSAKHLTATREPSLGKAALYTLPKPPLPSSSFGLKPLEPMYSSA
ncbi:hypothetical protein V2J09_024099 [Rumex salicifolius]